MSKGQYTCTACEQDFHTHCTNLNCPVAWHHLKSIGAQDVKDIESEGIQDPIERGRNESFEIGGVGSIEELPAEFGKRAGAAFEAGDDKKAYFFRELQKEFKERGEKMREAWTAKYHPGRKK